MSKILDMAAAGLELPPDIISGGARISLLGQEKIQVVNHRGIINYGQEQIILRLHNCRLKLIGSNFNLSELNDEQISIDGRIKQLIFEEESDED